MSVLAVMLRARRACPGWFTWPVGTGDAASGQERTGSPDVVRVVAEPDGHGQRHPAAEPSFRLIAENAPDVVALVLGGRITWVSPSVVDVLGWKPHEWVGTDPGDYVHPDDAPVRAAAREAAGGSDRGVTTLRVVSKDGTYHWMEASTRPFLDEHGHQQGLITAMRQIDDDVARQDLLRQRAERDDLTGLLNRHETIDRLTATLDHPPRTGHRLAVAFCDIDEFKTVNDTHGHATGDEALRVLAWRLRDVVREGDVVARFGGDEFLVVLDGVRDLDDAASVAEKIREQATEPIPIIGATVTVTMSIGITIAAPGEDVDTVIQRADHAMYDAKRLGRNQVIPIPGLAPDTG
jgi:diguanylate cyclase (GGDEF)-like protein/PAS domain S-box-containing protein